ncbi:DUF4192 domain-containing protein [Actinophytocola oryzae]|uniref:Uncharacterized protein DUF4192 n=1 Tax=Actinophytocola oryzae TaxID=502181 RepID=A0A4R7UUH7_9PSEU|nr:DUF4192 domain-containing protein [Actinophytocola oryzae]TDV40333.1 uncharacterized protein DUF4192 [Actinophytocola oryzae]
MTTSSSHTHIRLRDLSELVAGIPYVIGFPPTNSLVLFTFRRCPELRLSTTIRVDLPRPEHIPLVVTELTAAVVRNDAVAVVAVVVGDDGPEHGLLVDVLRKMLADKDILLSHSSWVSKIAHGEVWWCYDDPLCTGTVPDPQSSALAAARAVAGDTTYTSREAMAANLAADSKEVLERRRKLLSAYRIAWPDGDIDTDLRADLALVGHTLERARSSYDPPILTDLQLVRLARALSRTPVRDECLAVVVSDESEAAERLWTVLVRGLPAPERAEPAFLLAMSAYLRGEGVVAGLALKIVMEANPLHDLAVLLDRALQMGISPDEVRSLLVMSILRNDEAQTDSAEEEDDDPPWDTTPEPDPTTAPAQEAPQDEPVDCCPESGCDDAGSCDATLMFLMPPEPTARSEVPVFSALALVGSSGPGVVAVDDGLGFGPWYPGLVAMADPGRVPVTEPPRIAPGPLGRRDAAALGISGGAPVQRTTMDALAGYLPPPIERREPG